MPDTPVRFAIVGCGRIAQRHAAIISTKGILQSVCDVNRHAADSLAKAYGARAYYSLEEMLEVEKGLDLVAICTPNGLHAEHTIAALEAGLNVLCEKPMALKVADCKRMIETADKAGRKLIAVKQNRYNPPVAALKKFVDEGRLGKIVSAQLNCFWNRNEKYYRNSWKGTKELDGGTLFSQVSHFIDLLYWVMGDVDEVKAYTENFLHRGKIEFEDTGVAILKFRSGALATLNFTVNSFEKNMEGSFTVFGEKGTVKVGGQYLNLLEYQQVDGYKIEELPEGSGANNYGDYEGSMSNHHHVYENLIQVLRQNAPETAGAKEAMKTVEIISKIYEAAKNENHEA